MSSEPAENTANSSNTCQDDQFIQDLRVVLQRWERDSKGPDGSPDDLLDRRIGPYRIRAFLGEGGMARVYEAVDITSGMAVAVKTLKPQFLANPNAWVRFEREARGMAQIIHDHVVRILDFRNENDLRTIIMELVRGGSLRDRIIAARARNELIPAEQAVSYIVQAAQGMAAAHRVGIIHRDIKPSNLLLTPDNQLKVGDFGTILIMEGTTWLTGVGQQPGTLEYMSPEQCEGKRVTPASDVYSLGITLFELLTNRLPFEVEEDSPFAIMFKHISVPAPDPRTWRDELSDEMAAIILKSLAKNPDDRFSDAEQFVDALVNQPILRPAQHLTNSGPHTGSHFNIAAIRRQLLLLPQRAIACWACRCARRVQDLNNDPRVENALAMAEASLAEPLERDTPDTISRALVRIRSLRAASLKVACSQIQLGDPPSAAEAAKAAAAAAACAAAVCVDDAAADAAFAARSAIASLRLANRSLKPFWEATRLDYQKLLKAKLGQEGTIGRPIPKDLFNAPSS